MNRAKYLAISAFVALAAQMSIGCTSVPAPEGMDEKSFETILTSGRTEEIEYVRYQEKSAAAYIFELKMKHSDRVRQLIVPVDKIEEVVKLAKEKHVVLENLPADAVTTTTAQ